MSVDSYNKNGAISMDDLLLKKLPKNELNEELHDKLIGQLSDELIGEYLSQHPDFFNEHPELLATLRLSDTHRGTVSLVERQQQKLRQKVQSLEEEVTQLMTVANNNERLFMLYSDLYLRLIDCESANELLDCLCQTTTELLSLSGLKLWLNQSIVHDKLTHASVISDDCTEIMQSRLGKDNYYFGRLQQAEQQSVFAESQVGSVVLIKLETYPNNVSFDDSNPDSTKNTLGFLAISSEDAEHFDPNMDTLLLSQFRKLVAKLLQRHLL